MILENPDTTKSGTEKLAEGLVSGADRIQQLISRRVKIALSWILLIGFIGNFTSIEQDLYRPIDMAFSVYYAVWLATMFILLRKGWVTQTFKLFCWGYWSYACFKSLTVAGMHSPILGSIAPLIMVTAWVQSKRASILMLALSMAFYAVLAELENTGILGEPLARTATDLFIFYSMTAIAFLSIGLMIVDNAMTLMSTSTRLAEELASNVNELKASQIELNNLNAQLEQRF